MALQVQSTYRVSAAVADPTGLDENRTILVAAAPSTPGGTNYEPYTVSPNDSDYTFAISTPSNWTGTTDAQLYANAQPWIGWPLWIDTVGAETGAVGRDGFYYLQSVALNDFGVDFRLENFTQEDSDAITTEGRIAYTSTTGTQWSESGTTDDDVLTMYVVKRGGRTDTDAVVQRGANTRLVYPGVYQMLEGNLVVVRHLIQGRSPGLIPDPTNDTEAELLSAGLRPIRESVFGTFQSIDVPAVANGLFNIEGAGLGDNQGWRLALAEQFGPASWDVEMTREFPLE